MEETERFAELLGEPGRSFALDEAIALIAAHAPGGESVASQLARLDSLAEGADPDFASLIQHLFGPGRLTGNTVDYYDPQNSLLDHVLARRLGLPISLAIVAIEVGRRVGVDVRGIGMPGHFVISSAQNPELFADPFSGPSVLSADDCRAILARTGTTQWDDSFLDSIDNRAIIIRVLTNLKAAYARRGDVAGFRWVMRLRSTLPEFAEAERAELRRVMAALN